MSQADSVIAGLQSQVVIGGNGDKSERLKILRERMIQARESGDREMELQIQSEIIVLESSDKPDSKHSLEMVSADFYISTEPPIPEQIVSNLFDQGDKVVLIGSSKARKSFFLLQFALCLSTGKQFLTWSIPRKRRVVLVQMEIKSTHIHKRVRNLSRALEISTTDDNLQIINGRGLGPEILKYIGETISGFKPEIVMFDPLYKLMDGDENSTQDMKPTLKRFDEIAEASGATIFYVHHDPKGQSHERDIRDRGAGANVLGRDYDTCITLTSHGEVSGAVVVEMLLRNYQPRDKFTIEWREGSMGFFPSSLSPITRKAKGSKTECEIPDDKIIYEAIQSLSDPVPTSVFRETIKKICKSEHKQRAIFDLMISSRLIKKLPRVKGGGPEMIVKGDS